MEAKDTVMSGSVIDGLYEEKFGQPCLDFEEGFKSAVDMLLERQAEISFEIGHEQRQVELRIEVGSIAFAKGKKAGIKEVIEWGDKECKGHEGYQYSLLRRQCRLCWQDQKKK